eukprot:Nk52_evm12s237 gene=Nk52_evmTU12s237
MLRNNYSMCMALSVLFLLTTLQIATAAPSTTVEIEKEGTESMILKEPLGAADSADPDKCQRDCENKYKAKFNIDLKRHLAVCSSYSPTSKLNTKEECMKFCANSCSMKFSTWEKNIFTPSVSDTMNDKTPRLLDALKHKMHILLISIYLLSRMRVYDVLDPPKDKGTKAPDDNCWIGKTESEYILGETGLDADQSISPKAVIVKVKQKYFQSTNEAVAKTLSEYGKVTSGTQERIKKKDGDSPRMAKLRAIMGSVTETRWVVMENIEKPIPNELTIVDGENRVEVIVTYKGQPIAAF